MSSGWNWPYSLPDVTVLLQRLTQAEQTVLQLSERIGLMEKQIDEIKTRTPIHVEYHFDQLKVNELKGTLNVGLSPQGVNGIESFEVPGPGGWQMDSPQPADSAGGPIGDLQQQMWTYMDREAPSLLEGMERKNGISLGDARRLRVIQDVKNQLKERVHYYAKTTPYPSDGSDEERRIWERTVLDKTTHDVKTAFSTYLTALKGQPGT